MSSNANMLVMVAGLILIGVGVTLTWLWLRVDRQNRAAQRWPETTGVVVGNSVRPLIGVQAWLLSHGTLHPRAEPRIEYEYQVNGETYRSNRVRLGTLAQTVREATQTVAQYPPGTRLNVYYDPAQPQRACLERPRGGSLSGIVTGLTCVVIGALLMVM